MIVILTILLSSLLINQVYGSVYITDIKIRTDDRLMLEANILNNSNDTIAYTSLCDSPLEAEFDDNIDIEYGVACLGFAIETLEPFENATVRGPASGIFYKIVDQSLTKANVTFTYLVGEEQKSVSKEIVFNIGNGKKVGDKFDIKINQTVVYDDLEITLFDIEDSRCPIDVVCIWEGDAKLSLAIEKDDLVSNFIVSSSKPLLINNLAIEVVSLEEQRATLAIKEPEGSIKFKAYNDRYGLLGVFDLDNNGYLIFFDGNKRELLEFTAFDECYRLSMICLIANNREIEIGSDFVLIDKRYIPIVDIKSI